MRRSKIVAQGSATVIDEVALKSMRWGLTLAIFLVVIYRNRSMLDQIELLREVAIAVFAFFAYFFVRGVTEGSEIRAVENADRVIAFERSLGILWEPAWQRAIIDNHALVSLSNWIYIWAHWPLIIAVAIWLYTSWPATYRLYRNAFIFSGVIGLVVFAMFPVAPPRLADFDVVDTVTLHSRSYRVLQPPGLVNQYAAMPSLHFGWNMLIGVILFTRARALWARAAGVMIPIAMFFAVVFTANHYIIDAVAGSAVALVGLWIAAQFRTEHVELERIPVADDRR